MLAVFVSFKIMMKMMIGIIVIEINSYSVLIIEVIVMLINLYLKVRKIECLKIINNNNNLNKFNKPIDLIMWIPIIIMK